MNKKIKAVMMAGGFGTRIQPLTHSMPKPMLPICNIPMMEHTMRKLVDIGITEIVVLLYFKPEIIKNHFGDGSRIGVKLEYVLPEEDLGTAGAVGAAREFLDTTFIIVSGDLVSDFDFEKIIDHHYKTESKLTITLTSVENPLQFGVVIADENGKIEKFLEKPSWGEVFSDTINTGIYVIEPEILDYIPTEDNFDFAKDLFPLLMSEGIDLMSYDARGYWRDVGNPDSYREVYGDIFKQKIKVAFPGKKIEYPDGVLYLGEESEIDPSVEIIDTVIIGSHVQIGKNVRLHNVSIGDNVVIQPETKIRNSVLWHDIIIGKKCVFDNSIICNDTHIDDMVTAKAGVILAEGCDVGKLAVFDQDITVWPHKTIEAASIVNKNVIWGNKYKNSIFEDGRVTGKSNVEISCEMACQLAEAFAAHLPLGSTVIVGRDHSKSARMLKRAFLGGLLSGGVNIVDLKAMPPAVLRHNLGIKKELVAGIYFRQNVFDPTGVEFTFFSEEGLRIDGNMAKSVEKAFFQQDYRRVDYDKIGRIEENYIHHLNECITYKKAVKEAIDHKIIKKNGFRVAIDLMYGGTKDIFPEIISELQIENIILNSYTDYHKMANMAHVEKKSKDDISAIVKNLKFNIGFLMYPNGQQLGIVGDDGEVLGRIKGLFVVLSLLNLEAKEKEKKLNVFLPTWAPDLTDELFENLVIERGKYANFKADKVKKYDLVATIDGNFAFTEFSLHRDAMYASLKIMEMLSRHQVTISDISKQFERFYYNHIEVECSQAQKGKMMKRFFQEAKDKKSCTTDGVKIWENETDWILMIPDQVRDLLHLYVQAKDKNSGEALAARYEANIKEWM
ncbi:mannose-1-phosphate guanyltransferase [Sulfurovum sp. NBC37-1]|uniref:mannose-1-phosphate guanyltransferase n=1 Tax=Sulfurovum sp. (strain NBC37-1) TaxID=387093 RepID=UPI0001587BE3|nr:mannose-1-phosphate guanyltransferase [Sulfurovum sp. NBC37-1]BAF72228.1 mannose-1-phosphate guanylyltransferase [Sulfurovum sp. NBC37-1]